MLTVLIGLALQVAAAPAAAPQPLADLGHAEIEAFLRSAEIVDREAIPVGVTNPRRITLKDRERTARAVWKVVSEYSPIKRFDDGGPPEIGFRDSYKSEIAAYELDKILGFGFVPPTVLRKVRRETGSVQLWVEDCITEGERRRRGIESPHPEQWVRQVYNARLFRQLIHDRDYENLSNLLVDKEFKLWVVDSSRAFKTQAVLLDQAYLRRFSQQHLERLRELTPELLEDKLGRWLTKKQRESLLARRDLVLEHADRLIAESGAEAVLY